jgi:hypothetical protein
MECLVKAINCPDCGLALRVVRDARRCRLSYDFGEWQQRCERVDLDGPAWCLVQRDGASILPDFEFQRSPRPCLSES